MANKIDGMGGPGVQPSRTTGPTESGKARREATPPPATRETDDVQLTDSARRLHRLEAELAARPEVDEARVAEVKERIESGRFDVDPRRVAERLVKTEKDL